MNIVTADSALQSLFHGLTEKAEVRDDAGNLLGYLTPRQVEEELLYQHAEKVFDPAVIERQLEAQQTGYTIEQVMSHLRTLETH